MEILSRDEIFNICLFLDPEDLIAIRQVKYLRNLPNNKMLWIHHIDNMRLLLKNAYDKQFTKKYFSMVSKNKVNNKIVQVKNMRPSKYLIINRDILFPYLSLNLERFFPNVVHVDLRYCMNISCDFLDDLSKIQNLAFLYLYRSKITYDKTLTKQKVDTFLLKCRKLREVDFSNEKGLPFYVKIDKYYFKIIYDMIGNVSQKTIDDNIQYLEQNIPKKQVKNDFVINACKYPHIKRYDKCVFNLYKIPKYRILRKMVNEFS